MKAHKEEVSAEEGTPKEIQQKREALMEQEGKAGKRAGQDQFQRPTLANTRPNISDFVLMGLLFKIDSTTFLLTKA